MRRATDFDTPGPYDLGPETFIVRPGSALALEAGAAAHVRARGGRLTRADATVFAAAGSRGRTGPPPATVAVVDVTGLLAPGVPDWLGSDPHRIRAAVRVARLSPQVDAIALIVDSGGGSVEGIEEAAAEIARASAAKPTHAFVAGWSASAAYYLTSQAARVVVTPSGEVGSIGVFVTHQNLAGALDREGVEVEFIVSGVSPHKVEQAPTGPLSDSARAHLQGMVDRLGQQFVQAVAAGRHVTPGDVVGRFGGGRMVDARDAVRRGMADEVATVEDGLAGLVARLPRRAGVGASAFTPEQRRAPAPEQVRKLALAKLRNRA